jgi:hypothetical protein
MDNNKSRIVIDYDKLSEEIKEQIKLVYPEGYYQHLIEFKNAKGENISALRFETFDKIYLIRMSVKKAMQMIIDDSDYDDDGFLRDDIKEKYEDDHSDVEYLSENANYDDDDDDDDE